MAKHNDWMYAIPCPICEQPPLARCVDPNGKRRPIHPKRQFLAMRQRESER